MAQNIDELQIEIQSDATDATSGLDNLVKSLEKLKRAVGANGETARGLKELVPALKDLGKLKSVNLTKNVKELSALSNAVRNITNADFSDFGVKINAIIDGMTKLASVKPGNLSTTAEGMRVLKNACSGLAQLNADFAPRMTAIGNSFETLSAASKNLNSVNFTQFKANIEGLSGALQPLQGWRSQASSVLNALNGFPDAARALNEFDGFDAFGEKVKLLAQKMEPLGEIRSKLGATLDALTRVSQVSEGLKSVNFTHFGEQTRQLGEALKELNGVDTKLGSALNNLSRVGTVASELSAAMRGSTLSEDITRLVTALSGLNQIQKTNLGSIVNQLAKIPEVTKSLNPEALDEFARVVERLTAIVGPLAEKMQGIYNGFSILPPVIKRALSAMNGASTSAKRASKSFGNFFNSLTRGITKLTVLGFGLRRVATLFAGWLTESNSYIENLNLFTVTMGDATAAAIEYAEKVRDAMGIDVADWMRYQGTFQQMATGFGVSADKAAIMSQNLTQLAYDLSSFFNVDVETAFDKISSGMSGQIKGLKEYGINLSVAALQEYALSKGITQKVSSMTEAQKSLLRYNLLLERSSNAHGDMARTIVTPANSLRILNSQLTQMKRALGNIVSVIAVKVIPYVQAFVEVITEAAQALAAMWGFELPEIDYSGLSNAFADADDDADSLNGTVKEIKKQLMGFDELNVLSDNSSAGGAGGAGADWDLELGQYEFLGNLDTSKVDEIKGKLEDIVKYIPTVVGVLGTIRLSKFLTDLLTANMKVSTLKESLELLGHKASIMVGITLVVTGIAMHAHGAKDAVENAVDGQNFAEMIGGGAATAGGAAILGGKLAGWITTAFEGSAVSNAIATAGANLGGLSAGATGAAMGASFAGIILGIPTFFVGIYDAIKEGLNWLNGILIPAGATAAGAGIGAIIGMVGGPIGAGVGALIGLAVGALTDLVIWIVQEWEDIVAWFDKYVVKPVSKFFSKLWTGIKKIWKNAATWFDEKVIQPIVDFFEPIVDWISTFFEGCWLIIQACWIVASSWFNENVIQPVVGFFKGLWEDISGFFKELWSDIKGIWEDVSDWFDENVIQPVVGFFEDLWLDVSGFFSQLWSDVKGIWEDVSEWFDTNVIQPITDLFEGLWQGLHIGAVSAINAVIAAAESLVNILVDALNVVVGGFNVVVEWAADVCGKDWGGLDEFKKVEFKRLAVPQYAAGGFPAYGEMFIAKERGPELVGRIGSRTAVANNDQIVAGVANGVYQGVSAAMRENDGGNSGTQRVEIRIPLEIGNRVLGEAVAEWNNGVVKQTGKSPLLT